MEPIDDISRTEEPEDFEDDDWDGFCEQEPAPTRDLFSEHIFPTVADCLTHVLEAHGLDLAAIAGQLRLDIYGRVKLVNYVRSRAASGDTPAEVLAEVSQAAAAGASAPPPWENERFLTPVLAEDPLLYSLPIRAQDGVDCASALEPFADDEGETELEAAGDGDNATALLLQTVQQMRSDMASVLGLDEEFEPQRAATPAGTAGCLPAADGDGAARGGPSPTSARGTNSEKAACLTGAPAACEGQSGGAAEGQYGSVDGAVSDYFASYAKVRIHEEMLSDRVRTLGYREAIERNRHLFEGKVVLDVGCGTGILSMFAARAGARHVVGVDASDIVEHARVLVAENKLSHKVTLVRGTMETAKLPADIGKVDVILSEWMGYALLYESMLPSVLYARDQYLKQGGLLLPSGCDMRLCASSHERLSFWDDVYGFDFRHMAASAAREASIEVLPSESLLCAEACVFKHIDVGTCVDADLDFTAPFHLRVTRSGVLTSFVVDFDTIFDLTAAGGVRTSFATAADQTPTHWKQTVLYLKATPLLTVAQGDTIAGTVHFSRGREYKRAYDIAITYAVNEGPHATQLWNTDA